MVARTVLNKRENAAIERIQENLIELAGDDPEAAEVADRVKTARGPDEVHTRLFRMEAIADLTDTVRDNQPKAAKAATEVSKAAPTGPRKRGRSGAKKVKDDGEK